jgi:anthranilate/para-aminobenzoate synthase component I
VNYRAALLAAAEEPSLAAWVFHGEAGLAIGPARALRGWDDLDLPGRWFVVLPYEFPAVPGRAWAIPGTARRWRAGDEDLIAPGAPAARAPRISAAWDAAGHMARVRAAQESIAAGWCYQLNLGHTWTVELPPGDHADLDLHLALLAADPAAFACVVRGGDGPAVVGNSPELFLRIANGQAFSEPIKGTRRRIAGRETQIRAELDSSPKERAELAMITDLVRHDLGRVAQPGGVRVEDPGSVIDLPRLHHRIARVSAQLRPGLPLSQVVAACFPAGSITGAPKRAAMRRIAELEGAARGTWCGAYGLIGDGAAELAVAIRTVEIANGRLTLRAGGGIVADSDPAGEWDEARAKAQAIAGVLGVEI